MKTFHKEQVGQVRTKIVATVGPASTDPVVMMQMVEAGVDVFRLNFSHGSHESHSATLEMIRRIAAETETQIAVLQDLCGPKIRLGEIVGGVVDCDHDAEFVLVSGDGGGRRPSLPDFDLSHPGRRPGRGAERSFRRRHGGDGSLWLEARAGRGSRSRCRDTSARTKESTCRGPA